MKGETFVRRRSILSAASEDLRAVLVDWHDTTENKVLKSLMAQVLVKSKGQQMVIIQKSCNHPNPLTVEYSKEVNQGVGYILEQLRHSGLNMAIK